MIAENIIIVNDYSYSNGGASKVALTSAINLRKRGYNVILFTAIGQNSELLKHAGVQVISLNEYDILNNPNRVKAAFCGIWNKTAQKEFAMLLSKLNNNNTIIHIHSWTKALTSSVIREAIDKNFKIVLTLHDYFIACPNGGFYNYNTEKICEVESMSRQCLLCNCDSRKYAHKIWRIIRQLFQQKRGLLPQEVKNYIYISDLSKKVLSPYLPKDANLYYVKNPVDIDKEKQVDVKINKLFIYLGRLSKEKGCLLFAKAAKELNLNAMFIGDGELKNEIKDIYSNSIITGWLNKDQINDELKNARVLVFPSLWYETLGLTALEAQAKGIPVIVSDTSATREVVKNGETGLWFKGGNLQDLIEKIQLMINDKLVEMYGENAYKNYWSDNYSIDNHIDRLEEVYNDILERGKK